MRLTSPFASLIHSVPALPPAVGSVASAGVASVAKSVSVEDFDFDSGAEHTSLDGSDEYAALTVSGVAGIAPFCRFRRHLHETLWLGGLWVHRDPGWVGIMCWDG